MDVITRKGKYDANGISLIQMKGFFSQIKNENCRTRIKITVIKHLTTQYICSIKSIFCYIIGGGVLNFFQRGEWGFPWGGGVGGVLLSCCFFFNYMLNKKKYEK